MHMKLRIWATTIFMTFGIGAVFAEVPEAERKRALDMSCDIARSTVKGADHLANSYLQMAVRFGETQKKALAVQLQGQLKNYALTEASVFKIADYEGLLIEYLILARSKQRGVVYFRMRFEPYGDEMTLINIKFNSDFKKIADVPFSILPERAVCSE